MHTETQFGKYTFAPKGGHFILHNDADAPALELPSGYVAYYKDGRRDREVGPAVITARGVLKYYKEGKLHCEDGAAIVYPSGARVYCINGQLHNEKGPAIITHNGVCVWYVKGKRLSREKFDERFPQTH